MSDCGLDGFQRRHIQGRIYRPESVQPLAFSVYKLTDRFITVDQDTWDKIFSVNVRGMMFCYKWAAKQMIKQGKGGKLIGRSIPPSFPVKLMVLSDIGGCSVAGLTGKVTPFNQYDKLTLRRMV